MQVNLSLPRGSDNLLLVPLAGLKSIHVSLHRYSPDRLTRYLSLCLSAAGSDGADSGPDASQSLLTLFICLSGFIWIWTCSVTLQALSLLSYFCLLCSVSPENREDPGSSGTEQGKRRVQLREHTLKREVQL